MSKMSRINFIHQVHIADGFADDCEELIHRWLNAETLTYETFCEIWKDMQFGYIYHGRSSGAEMAELAEEVIFIAKHYMTADTSNFEETVAGVFLVYGLLNLQPFPGFAALRICPEDVPAIKKIEMIARKQKRYDVLYALGAVLTRGPVRYHAAPREHGMESSVRKYLEGITGIDRLGVRPKGVFYRQTEELDIIRELGSITRRYSDAKKALVGNNRTLQYANEGFARDLDTSLKKIINGIIDDSEEANEKITEHYNKVQAVKEKAMRGQVDGAKFLRAVSSAGTAGTVFKSPEKRIEKGVCQIKSYPGKVKLGSPRKPVTSLGQRKSGCIVPRKQKRRRASQLQENIMIPDLDDVEEKVDVRNDSNDVTKDVANDVTKDLTKDVTNDVTKDLTNDVTKDLTNDVTNYVTNDVTKDLTNDVTKDVTNDVCNDFNLDNFDKPLNNETSVTASELDIAIESLPVFIRTEEAGNTFEIEIIDEFNDAEGQTAKKRENSDNILRKLSEITFKRLERCPNDTVAPCTTEKADICKSNSGNVEKRDPLKLKRPERRDLKRVSLKSKFKKQGMLNVANFEETDEIPTKGKKLRRLRSRTKDVCKS